MLSERQRTKGHGDTNPSINVLAKQTLPLTGEDLGTSPGLPSAKVMLCSTVTP